MRLAGLPRSLSPCSRCRSCRLDRAASRTGWASATMNQANTLPDLHYQQVARQPGAVRRQPGGTPLARELPRGDDADHRLGQCGGGRRPRPACRDAAAALRIADRRRPVGHDAGDRRDRAPPAAHRLPPRPRLARDARARFPQRAGPRAEEPVPLQRRSARSNPSCSTNTPREEPTITPSSTPGSPRPTTTRSANGPAALASTRSPLARNVCRQLECIQRDLARIRPGWFHVGRKWDVPRDACYVGRHGHRYVWVGPEGREALTEFTLTVMKLSSLIKETQTLLSPGSGEVLAG